MISILVVEWITFEAFWQLTNFFIVEKFQSLLLSGLHSKRPANKTPGLSLTFQSLLLSGLHSKLSSQSPSSTSNLISILVVEWITFEAKYSKPSSSEERRLGNR